MTLEQKKFTDVVRLGHRSTVDVLKVGDYITITEKLDGANASFTLVEDSIIAFSRNNPLSDENTLRGFLGYTQTLNPKDLNPNYIYFGEWLVKHKIDYGENANKFYLFDLWDKTKHAYLPLSIVRSEAERLNLTLVPVFYEGEYVSYEHLDSFRGQTVLGVNEGEGIVVKNVDYLDKFGRQLYVKMVTDKFSEIQHQKAPKNPNINNSVEGNAVAQVLTKARVEKLIYKLIDQGILEENFGIEDMKTILINLKNSVYEDIMKEESDLIKDFEQKTVQHLIGRNTPKIVKEIILEKNN